jgi:hypothetical protein
MTHNKNGEQLFYVYFPQDDRTVRNLTLAEADDVIESEYPQRSRNGEMLGFRQDYPEGLSPEECHPEPNCWEFYTEGCVLFATVDPMPY